MNIAHNPHSKYVPLGDSFLQVYCSQALLTASNFLLKLTPESLYPWKNSRTSDCSRKARPPEREECEWQFDWSSLTLEHENVCEWLLKAVSRHQKCHVIYKPVDIGSGRDNVQITGIHLEESSTSTHFSCHNSRKRQSTRTVIMVIFERFLFIAESLILV